MVNSVWSIKYLRPTESGCDTRSVLTWGTRLFPLGPLVQAGQSWSKASHSRDTTSTQAGAQVSGTD